MNTINPKELQAWLDQEPLETDVFQKGSGVYIPVEIIKPRLDILDPHWCTRNYKHFVFVDHDGKLFCSGSVDLVIHIWPVRGPEVGFIERTIVGAATFDTAEYNTPINPNTHYGQTCLSLCIVAAAKEIGRFFGRDLNKVVQQADNKIANTFKKLNA